MCSSYKKVVSYVCPWQEICIEVRQLTLISAGAILHESYEHLDACLGRAIAKLKSSQTVLMVDYPPSTEAEVSMIILPILISVITTCAKRTGPAASVERRRREPARAISVAGVTHAQQCQSFFQ